MESQVKECLDALEDMLAMQKRRHQDEMEALWLHIRNLEEKLLAPGEYNAKGH